MGRFPVGLRRRLRTDADLRLWAGWSKVGRVAVGHSRGASRIPRPCRLADTSNRAVSDHVLINQHKAHIEHFARQEDGSWSLREASSGGSVLIRSVSVTRRGRAVLRGVRSAELSATYALVPGERARWPSRRGRGSRRAKNFLGHATLSGDPSREGSKVGPHEEVLPLRRFRWSHRREPSAMRGRETLPTGGWARDQSSRDGELDDPTVLQCERIREWSAYPACSPRCSWRS